jgi:hypothetical protein
MIMASCYDELLKLLIDLMEEVQTYRYLPYERELELANGLIGQIVILVRGIELEKKGKL